MPPMEIVTDKDRREAGTLRMRFVRNTTEAGVDYGPDYPKRVADVPYYRALGYLNSGRAVLVKEAAPAAAAEAVSQTSAAKPKADEGTVPAGTPAAPSAQPASATPAGTPEAKPKRARRRAKAQE